MEIRAARRDEWLVCADIYVRAGRAAFSWVDPDEFQPADIIECVEGGDELYLAFDGDRPVAMLSFWRPDNFLHNLFVEPEAQGQGVGRALLEFAFGLAGGPVTLKCDALNEAALKFYRRRGLIEADRGIGPRGRPYILLRQA